MEHLVSKENAELLNVLANPADARHAYSLNIQSLVTEFPQSGLLRALLAAGGDEQNAQHAAVYFNPAILYKAFHAPDSLPLVTAEQIVHVQSPLPVADEEPVLATITQNEELNSAGEMDHFASGLVDITENTPQYLIAEGEAAVHYPAAETEDIKQDLADVEIEIGDEAAFEPVAIENPAAESVYAEPVTEVAEESNTQNVAGEPEYFHQDIEDEIYEEIVSIEDITLEKIEATNSTRENEVIDKHAHHEETASIIPPADHFVFDPVIPVADSGDGLSGELPGAAENVQSFVYEKQDISRYHDEKLPYTFMWWLDKTRKEHAGIYQPYLNSADFQRLTPKNAADELQHQYVENIFNLNAIEELERNTSSKNHEPVIERKEDKIIKRFIEAEPQIKHPSGVKLDNENKAKKSSEEHEELVTETLARIYTEQMLYQKAIAAYKKLMLKFPEKSLYFAGQIEQLEKKPN